jgi:hypothetical protein
VAGDIKRRGLADLRWLRQRDALTLRRGVWRPEPAFVTSAGIRVSSPLQTYRHIVLLDILDGLVAAGTLALAGSTVWLGRATGRAVKEAYKARIDATAHRVVLNHLEVEDCLSPRKTRDRSPTIIPPLTPWDLTQHGAANIGLGATVQIRNEGQVSVLFRVSWIEGSNIEWRDDVGIPTERREGRWQLLLPGGIAPVGLIWWQSAKEWAAAAGGDVPTATVTVTFRDAMGGAVDDCHLTFGAHVLVGHPTRDGWLIAARDMNALVSDPPAPPFTRISALRRSYPSEPK